MRKMAGAWQFIGRGYLVSPGTAWALMYTWEGKCACVHAWERVGAGNTGSRALLVGI